MEQELKNQLEAVMSKGIENMTPDDFAFLKARRVYLNAEQVAKFGLEEGIPAQEVASEEPKSEGQEEVHVEQESVVAQVEPEVEQPAPEVVELAQEVTEPVQELPVVEPEVVAEPVVEEVAPVAQPEIGEIRLNLDSQDPVTLDGQEVEVPEVVTNPTLPDVYTEADHSADPDYQG